MRDEKNEAPSPDHASVDRAAAFAVGAGGIPRKVVALFVICVLVLGLGGVLADHFFPGQSGGSATATTTGSYPPALPSASAVAPQSTHSPGAQSSSTPSDTAQLPASQASLMGLSSLKGERAPSFVLIDQSGRSTSLASLRGKVVVLSFFDSSCDDICPVLGAELSQASVDLRSDASQVAFVTINTDPLVLNETSEKVSLDVPELRDLGNWLFLTGSLRQLNTTWKAYGVAIDVQRSTQLVSHNDVLYFIDAAGRLRFRAVPYANETRRGAFSLPRSTEKAWARGIADSVLSLLVRRS